MSEQIEASSHLILTKVILSIYKQIYKALTIKFVSQNLDVFIL
jgi:hypothetical protein